MTRNIAVSIFALGIALASSRARADDDSTVSRRVVNGRPVHVLPPIAVHGQRQAPLQFVTSRAGTGYAARESSEHFVRPVVDAVRRTPF